MKVILKDNIKGVGKKDQIINVADGYAKNFLFPKNLAIIADNGNINNLKAKQSSEQKRKLQELNEAKELAKKISTLSLTISAKSGENGKLFGAITSKEISENLQTTYNIQIDKRKFHLNESIKQTGVYNVTIKLYEGVTANLKIAIV